MTINIKIPYENASAYFENPWHYAADFWGKIHGRRVAVAGQHAAAAPSSGGAEGRDSTDFGQG